MKAGKRKQKQKTERTNIKQKNLSPKILIIYYLKWKMS